MVRSSRTTACAPSRSLLLTTKMSPISKMPAFAAWIPSPMPGASRTRNDIGRLGHLQLRLADPDRFDDHRVESSGIECA